MVLDLWQAAAQIARGGVVAVATGSSYALCARALDPQAVERVLVLKTSARQTPMATVIGAWEQLRWLVRDVPSWVWLRHRAFWPGACTLILPAVPSVPRALCSAQGAVGVRVAETDFLRTLAAMVGPLTATSANPTGADAAYDAHAVARYFPGLPVYGICGSAAPSTMVDATVQPALVLRAGALVFDPRWTMPGRESTP